MRNLFTKHSLSISLVRLENGKIKLHISSDYSQSARKSQLYVNEKRLAEDVEKFWKSIKTKKLSAMSVSFDEIDWYDNMTNIYETPIVRIERGLKKARVTHQDHGSIPKDWSVDLHCMFEDTTTNTPILEVVKGAVGSYLDTETEKKFIKELKPFLQKKAKSCGVDLEYAY